MRLKKRAAITFSFIPYYLSIIAIALCLILYMSFFNGSKEKVVKKHIQLMEPIIEQVGYDLGGFIVQEDMKANIKAIVSKVNESSASIKFEDSQYQNSFESNILDPWNNSYICFLKNTTGSKGEIFIISKGADGELFTRDDIGCSILCRSIENGIEIEKNEDVFIDGCNTIGHDYSEKKQTALYLKKTASCQSGDLYYYACSICNGRGSDTYEVGEKLEHRFEERFARTEYLDHASNCTECAEYFYKCIYCDLKGTETFEFGIPYGHEFTEKVEEFHYIAVPGTCYSKQEYYYKCANCDEYGDDTYESEENLDHLFVNLNVSDEYIFSPATCLSPAIYYLSCKYCGTINYDEVFEYGEALGHDFSSANATDLYWEQPVKCGEIGKFHYSCTRCGEVSDDVFECVLEHEFSKMDPTDECLLSGATCVNEAQYYYKCRRCDKIGEETYSFGGTVLHDVTAMVANEKYLATEASCTSKATYYYSCKMCGGIDGSVFEYGEMLSHVPNNVPSCSESQFCVMCGNVLMDPIRHVFDTKFPTSTYLKEPATCKTQAVYYYKCNNCDAHSGRTYLYGGVSDHDYVIIEQKEASCINDGFIDKKCQMCGDVYRKLIASYGHLFVEVEPFIPECGNEGWTSGTSCVHCGETTCEKIFNSMHEFVGGVCKHCSLSLEVFAGEMKNGSSFIMNVELDSKLINIFVPEFITSKRISTNRFELSANTIGYGEVTMVYEDYIYKFIVCVV